MYSRFYSYSIFGNLNLTTQSLEPLPSRNLEKKKPGKNSLDPPRSAPADNTATLSSRNAFRPDSETSKISRSSSEIKTIDAFGKNRESSPSAVVSQESITSHQETAKPTKKNPSYKDRLADKFKTLASGISATTCEIGFLNIYEKKRSIASRPLEVRRTDRLQNPQLIKLARVKEDGKTPQEQKIQAPLSTVTTTAPFRCIPSLAKSVSKTSNLRGGNESSHKSSEAAAFLKQVFSKSDAINTEQFNHLNKEIASLLQIETPSVTGRQSEIDFIILTLAFVADGSIERALNILKALECFPETTNIENILQKYKKNDLNDHSNDAFRFIVEILISPHGKYIFSKLEDKKINTSFAKLAKILNIIKRMAPEQKENFSYIEILKYFNENHNLDILNITDKIIIDAFEAALKIFENPNVVLDEKDKLALYYLDQGLLDDCGVSLNRARARARKISVWGDRATKNGPLKVNGIGKRISNAFTSPLKKKTPFSMDPLNPMRVTTPQTKRIGPDDGLSQSNTEPKSDQNSEPEKIPIKRVQDNLCSLVENIQPDARYSSSGGGDVTFDLSPINLVLYATGHPSVSPKFGLVRARRAVFEIGLSSDGLELMFLSEHQNKIKGGLGLSAGGTAGFVAGYGAGVGCSLQYSQARKEGLVIRIPVDKGSWEQIDQDSEALEKAKEAAKDILQSLLSEQQAASDQPATSNPLDLIGLKYPQISIGLLNGDKKSLSLKADANAALGFRIGDFIRMNFSLKPNVTRDFYRKNTTQEKGGKVRLNRGSVGNFYQFGIGVETPFGLPIATGLETFLPNLGIRLFDPLKMNLEFAEMGRSEKVKESYQDNRIAQDKYYLERETSSFDDMLATLKSQEAALVGRIDKEEDVASPSPGKDVPRKDEQEKLQVIAKFLNQWVEAKPEGSHPPTGRNPYGLIFNERLVLIKEAAEKLDPIQAVIERAQEYGYKDLEKAYVQKKIEILQNPQSWSLRRLGAFEVQKDVSAVRIPTPFIYSRREFSQSGTRPEALINLTKLPSDLISNQTEPVTKPSETNLGAEYFSRNFSLTNDSPTRRSHSSNPIAKSTPVINNSKNPDVFEPLN